MAKYLNVKSGVSGIGGKHMKPGAYPIGDKLTIEQARAIAAGGRAYLSDEAMKAPEEPKKEGSTEGTQSQGNGAKTAAK